MTSPDQLAVELANTKTSLLVEMYNKATGKSIKKFSSRAAAIKQTVDAVITKLKNDPPQVARLVEDPVTKLLSPAAGVDATTLTVEERAQMAKRINEMAPTLPKFYDKAAADRFAEEAARRNAVTQYVIAAEGQGYLMPGEQQWTQDPALALVYLKRDAAEGSLGTLFHRNAAPEYARVIVAGEALPQPFTSAERAAARAEQERIKRVAQNVKPGPKKNRKERQFGKSTKVGAAKTPRVPKAPKAARLPDGVSLAAICAELKIDPRQARIALRAAGTRAPGGRWEWPAADVAKVKAELAFLRG